jgi:hypothetical protein
VPQQYMHCTCLCLLGPIKSAARLYTLTLAVHMMHCTVDSTTVHQASGACMGPVQKAQEAHSHTPPHVLAESSLASHYTRGCASGVSVSGRRFLGTLPTA